MRALHGSPGTARRLVARALAVLALSGVGASTLVARDAHAQSRAQDLFREGRQAAERGDWAVACARFNESLTLENSVGALVNLGECNQRQGKLALALSFWRRGLERMEQTDPRRDLADRSIADLEKRTPKVVVMVPDATRVFVDGQPARAREPFFVDPGAHTIVLFEERSSRTIEVTIREGEVLPVEPKAETPAPAAPPAPGRSSGKTPATAQPDETEDDPYLVPAIVGYGVAGVGVIGFAVTGGLYLGERSTVNSECDEADFCTDAGLAAGERGFNYGVANAVFAGVAILGAGFGTTMIILRATDDGGGEVEARVKGNGLELRGSF